MEMRRLEELGRRADAAIENELSKSDDLARVRARLEGRVRSRRRVRVVAVLAPIAAAAALILALFAMRRPLAMTVAGTPAAPGTFVAAEANPLPIRFNDGTEIDVHPSGRARVVSVANEGARLVLERGALTARVVHKRNADWHVAAGPFDVHVIGTKFDLSWDPEREVLRLDLREGAVIVSGGLLDRGRRVSAGETLRVETRAGRTELVATSSLSVPSATASASAAPIELPPVPIPSIAPTSPIASASTHAPRAWQVLANGGKYTAALESAKQIGFAHECEQASASDVLLLGDVARLAGDASSARDAYRAVRRRFPKSSFASNAAFALGRLAFERHHAYAEAAGWFETALREGGPFAREAAGRLIEAKKAGGDLAGAKVAARNYLDRWPTGPHAALAKGLLAE